MSFLCCCYATSIILGKGSANDWMCYYVIPSLIGQVTQAHTQNDICAMSNILLYWGPFC